MQRRSERSVISGRASTRRVIGTLRPRPGRHGARRATAAAQKASPGSSALAPAACASIRADGAHAGEGGDSVSLRSRLWLVLGALFLVPLVVGVLVFASPCRSARTTELERVAESGRRSWHRTRGRVSAARPDRADGRPGGGRLGPDAAVTNAVRRWLQRLRGGARRRGTVVAEAGGLPGGRSPAAHLASCTGAPAALGRWWRAAVPVEGHRRRGHGCRGHAGSTGNSSTTSSPRGPGEIVLLAAATSSRRRRPPARSPHRRSETAGRVWSTSAMARTGRTPSAARRTPSSSRRTPASAPDAVLLVLLLGALVAGGPGDHRRARAEPAVHGPDRGRRARGRRRPGDRDRPDDCEGEAGRLGEAFNRMTTSCGATCPSWNRAGRTCATPRTHRQHVTSTHDMDGLLRSCSRPRSSPCRPCRGRAVRRAEELHPGRGARAARGRAAAPAASTPGPGVLGRVVASGEGVRGRLGSGPAVLEPAPNEPDEGDISRRRCAAWATSSA